MAQPVPSPSQIIAITEAKTLALAGAAGQAQSIIGLNAAIIKYTDIDNFAKANFDWLNDSVIKQYELERRWMDGQIIAAQITQTDLNNFVTNYSGRLWNGGDYEPLRIPEFDGTPLAATNDEHEDKLFDLQDDTLDWLQNGVTGMVTFGGTTIDTALTSLSTTLELNTGGSPLSLSIGNRFIVKSGSNAAIVEVTSYAQGGSCSLPIYLDEASCLLNAGVWTIGNAILGIKVLIPPQGTLAIGSSAGTDLFDGFNNTERTTKTPTNTWENALMTSLLESLEDEFNRRLAVLNSELAAIQANGNTNISASAATNVQNSITSVGNFLGVSPTATIDISNTGITAINAEKTTRQAQITARITQIASEITAGDFYGQRYNEAANRVQLANGTMVQLQDLQKALAGANSAQASATALAGRYDNMLP